MFAFSLINRLLLATGLSIVLAALARMAAA